MGAINGILMGVYAVVTFGVRHRFEMMILFVCLI